MTGPRSKRRLAGSGEALEGGTPADEPPASACRTPEGMGLGYRGDRVADEAADAERELMLAIREYQRASKRMFPTWSEILEIVHELGYRKPG
jgi:hypothetical protein